MNPENEHLQQADISLPTARCATNIYDEVLSDPDPALQTIITQFAAKGVQVHVQLVKSMADEGYSFDEGDQYVDDIINGCSWNTNNAITIVVSGDPRYFDVALSGSQADYNDNNEVGVDGVAGVLRSYLRDGGTDTYQDDAAITLQQLYGVEYEAKTPVVNPQQPEVAQPPKESTNRNIDVPVVPIVEVGFGIIVLAGAAAQVVRRRSIRSEREKFVTTIQHDKELVTSAYITSDAGKEDVEEALIKMIPDGDAPRLRNLDEKVQQGNDDWKLLLVSSEEELRSIGHKFWPNRQRARDVVANYKNSAADYLTTIEQYVAERAAYLTRKEAINETAESVRAAASSTSESVGALKAPDASMGDVVQPAGDEGRRFYRVAVLENKLAEIQALLARADELREDYYVDKPYELYTQATKQLKDIQEFVDGLPAFHTKLIEGTITNRQEQENRTTTLAELTDIVKAIETDYDESCWAECKEQLKDAVNHHARISDELTAVADPNKEPDIEKLMKDKEGLEQITELEERFIAAETYIHKHKRLLADLRDNLPGEIDQLLQDQANAETFIHENAADIEDLTEEEIFVLRGKIEALKPQVGVDKPEYLTIDAMRGNLKSKLEEAQRKATAERQEMIDLRRDIEVLAAETRNAILDARQYEASNSDVDSATEQDIASLDLPEAPRARHRAALRAAKSSYEEAIREAQSALSDARSDVRREEAEREQARQAALAAARRAEESRRAAEQARQASQTIHISGGFGGGTHHNSGSF